MKRNYLYYLLIVLLLAVSCEKDEMAYTTTVDTQVSSITATTAQCGGIISSDGNPTIKEAGVEWCTTSDFESNVSCASTAKAKLGKFACKITNLKANTQYYVRAYARNSYGTVYGEVLLFKTEYPFFSVSSSKQVTFSPGNLQYHPANNKWRFAESQTDYIGSANSKCSSTYNGWLDLFGWSTSANNFGVSTSTYYDDYYGSFIDWGTNKIGSDAPNTWRTLTYDEWEYLLDYRPKASSLKGVARVNGVNGLILLPDNWTCPSGVTFKSGFYNNYGVVYYAAHQTFTAAEWSKLESEGAVFLPAAGYRFGSYLDCVQLHGRYWSATENDSSDAHYLDVYSYDSFMDYFPRNFGLSVRLVKDL